MCMPRPTTAATWRRSSPYARSRRPQEGGSLEAVGRKPITGDVNGDRYEREVDARRLLIPFIRDDLDLTGSHIGCDTGNCGASSVLLDATLVKSCMLLAVQADGAKIETVEGLAAGGAPNGLQPPPAEPHGLPPAIAPPRMQMTSTAIPR